MKPLPVLGAALASVFLVWTTCAGRDPGQCEPKASNAKTPPKPALPPGTPAEQVKALIEQHEKAMTAVQKLFEAAKTEKEQEKLESLIPEPEPYATLLLQIAEKNPKEPAAVDALVWVLRNRSKASVKAREILVRDHLMSPKIGPLCLTLRHEHENPAAVVLLRRVLAENPSKEAQAQAAMGLAKLLQSRASFARQLQNAAATEMPKWEKAYGKETVAYHKSGDVPALVKEAEALLERIKRDRDFAETTVTSGEGKLKLGDWAGRELFEMRHLQPGKPAPEIAGEDIDGKPMKLSDFRGKVVLLDFWGMW